MWKEELRLRFIELETACRSTVVYNQLAIRQAVVNMDTALNVALRAWLQEDEYVEPQDKERVRQRDCHFPEVLDLVQGYCGLDSGIHQVVLAFRNLRNEIQYTEETPSPHRVCRFLPAIRKLLLCLGVNPQATPPPVPQQGTPTETVPPELTTTKTPGSKYAPLSDYLKALPARQDQLALSFSQVEKILGNQLPPSAYKYREWWANDAVHHSHARGWVGVGWKVDRVDLGSTKVVFRRSQD